ncbi:MAG: hypothetical protein JO336_15125 [Acidobacteriia bacterium]|nr:hypothetical protein [Terriglobia bacterium]
MNATEQMKMVRELLESPGPCITVALAGREVAETAIELKEAIRTIRKELGNRSIDIDAFVEPIATYAAELRAEMPRAGASAGSGIVILRSPSISALHRAPVQIGGPIPPAVRVADRFDARTILSIMAAQRDFYILALSQKRPRLLRCTQNSSEEVPFPAGTPSSLADAMQTRQPDHDLANHSSGGPSIGAGSVVFGTSSDRDAKNEYLLHYFRELDKAVNALLKSSGEPLILAGVDYELALYGRVNTYSHLLDTGIQGAPDGLEGGEMHRRALQILDQREQEPGREVPADFDGRAGSGHASVHLHEIVAAAYQGRVSHLFFQGNARYVGIYDPVRQRVKHSDDPLDSPEDLVETAAYQTVLQGGEARILPASAMPNGVPVCAVFRYAAPQPAAVEEMETAKH